MYKKRFISILLVIMLTMSLFQTLAAAGAQEVEGALQRDGSAARLEQDSGPPDSPEQPQIPKPASVYPPGITRVTYDKTGHKVKFRVDSGYDLDQYLYRDSSPIEFSIDMKGYKVEPGKSAKLTLRVWDVDQDGSPGNAPEVDRVYVNGVYLGSLTGANNQWSTVTFSMDASSLQSGVNDFQVEIDVNNVGWAVTVDWAEIEIPFSIAHIESKAYNDITIKRGTTDDKIQDTIWKTDFSSNGGIVTPATTNDPIADDISGGWFGWGARKFKYEYNIGYWPSNARPSWTPKVKYYWKIMGSNGKSDGFIEKSGWKNDFDVTIPDRVGKYFLQVIMKIYNDDILMTTEFRVHTLYVLLDGPVGSVRGADSGTPRTAWLDLAVDWADGQKSQSDILKALNTNEYANPLGWKYGYYPDKTKVKEDAVTMIENGAGKNSDCYVFRDVWRILAASLGIKTKDSNYVFSNGFLTSTRPALDNNASANAFKRGSAKADRWLFGSHALGSHGGVLYDPTFGLTGTDPEGNIYAKGGAVIFDPGSNSYKIEFNLLNPPPDKVLVSEKLPPSANANGWSQFIYEEPSKMASASISDTAPTDTAAPTAPAGSAAGSGFTGNFIDTALDDDGNGLYDYLKADAEVNITASGTYTFSTYLLDKDNRFIAFGSLIPGVGIDISNYVTTAELNDGVQYIPFYFSGAEIKASGMDGPYSVAVNIYDNNGSILDTAVYTTAGAYTADSFQGVLLENAVVSHHGGDEDGDGLFDTLSFDIALDVLAPGDFTFEGMLFAGDIYLDSADISTQLNAGRQTVSLELDGKTIRNSGMNGPYTLYINLSDQKYAAELVYETGSYNYTDFQTNIAYFTGITADSAYDADADGDYDELSVTAGLNSTVPGTYTVHGILQDDEGNFIAAAETSIALDNTAADANLRFQGEPIYRSGLDGPYQVILALTDEDGNELTAAVHVTGSYLRTQFGGPQAFFNNSFTDYGVDSDEDGAYEALAIEVGIDVSQSEFYTVEGSLHDNEGSFIASASTELYLYPGTHTVTLSFNGNEIRKHAADGPYTLLSVELLQPGLGGVDTVLNAYTTDSYSYTDFVSGDIFLTGPISDRGVDSNGNGLYDSLSVTMEVFVPESAYYSYNARLADSGGNEIVWASGNQYLNSGIQNILLSFNGQYIYGSGQDGPYEVKDLSIYSSSQSYSLRDVYATGRYSWDAFEACGIVGGRVTADGRPVENANVYISGVNSDLTNNRGEYRLNVFADGTYRVTIDADPELAPWEIWVNGEKLTEGTSVDVRITMGQSVEVNFVSTKVTQRPPVLDAIGDKTIKENQELHFTVTASDPDGDTVTLSAGNLPSGASFDAETGVFIWTPDFTQAGTYTGISFEATDGELSDSEEITITVIDTTPQELIADLAAYIEDLDLNILVEASLLSTLKAAELSCDKQQYLPALVQMNIFIIKVNVIRNFNLNLDDILEQLGDRMDELGADPGSKPGADSFHSEEAGVYSQGYEEMNSIIEDQGLKAEGWFLGEEADYLIESAETIIQAIISKM